MKKIFLTLPAILGFVTVTAQSTGTISYEEKVKLEIKLDGVDAKIMESIPKEHVAQRKLYFTADASLYENSKEKKESSNIDHETEDGGRMVIKMDEPDDKAYCDVKNNKRIEQRDFMSRKFLVETSLDQMQWKLTGNEKKILDYPCQEAILQDTAKKVTAWFTPAIPVSTGPGGYSNLPGLILSIDIDNGKRTIIAKGVDMKNFDTSILVKPKEGKKVTKEEFNKIVAQKKKEMQDENGGHGDVIIKIRN